LSDNIVLKKVRVNNLQGVSLELPHDKLIVFSGVSGSGKSSLAFETIYLEGQRRYIESLSSHTQHMVKGLAKPDADLIEGISPTIAIEQKNSTGTVRSTVATLTKIYDYLRIAYAKIAIPYCPVSSQPVEPLSKEQIILKMEAIPEKSKIMILSPIIRGKKSNLQDDMSSALQKGFVRARIDGKVVLLEEEITLDPKKRHDMDLVIDRLTHTTNSLRLQEAVYLAIELSLGRVIVIDADSNQEYFFSTESYCSVSNLSYEALQPADFSFNHPKGMCDQCHGLQIVQEFDVEKVIDPDKSISEDCCLIASSFQTVRYGNIYKNLADLFNFNINTPWKKLSKEAKDAFLYGVKNKWLRMHFVHPIKKIDWMEYVQWNGVLFEAKQKFLQAKSDSYKKRMAPLMEEMICPSCHGSRLKPYPSSAKLYGKTIQEIVSMPIDQLLAFTKTMQFDETKTKIADLLFKEIRLQLQFLCDVGVSYLTLDRATPTLSGGEVQRVKLASYLGCGLVGITYILDEPSIGLHQKDNHRLIETLIKLKERGNTVIIVEHDEETILHADHIVDLGPGAGKEGGMILYEGDIKGFLKTKNSLTADYLSKKKSLLFDRKPHKATSFISLKGATHNNLKNVDLSIPLGGLTTITGVSGSGKSSLILDTLYPALNNKIAHTTKSSGHFTQINEGDIDKVIAIDQSPIGRSPRSNPMTYTKIFDPIRDLFTKLPESKARGYKVGRFSFNVADGSCSRCLGYGMLRIDMDFMEDVWTKCPQCLGKRFDPQTLSIYYRAKNIYDVLNMSITEAAKHFENIPQIYNKLQMLLDVGLGYIKLGQSATTLSGGEAQRIKLAKYLLQPSQNKTLYIFDEPTTGLHFHDISHLLEIFFRLLSQGNTLVVIEHNLDIISNADWICDLGPEGGNKGGEIIFQGTKKELLKSQTSTAIALKNHLYSSYVKTDPTTTPLQKNIIIQNATTHNLQHVDIEIPRGEISVITGPSGSGKSSLAFDTLYSEGQNRYTETLSSYIRSSLKQMPKASVQSIHNLLPSIAIEQKSHSLNSRSTIGTITESYDLLRLLYAHVGVPHCPTTKEVIQAISKESVVQKILSWKENSTIWILAPLAPQEITQEHFSSLQRQGFLRIRLNKKIIRLDEPFTIEENRQNSAQIVIDRLLIKQSRTKRLFEAVETASSFGDKKVIIFDEKKDHLFNLNFCVLSTGQSYPEITPQTFLFNHEKGMCLECSGLGFQYGADFASHFTMMTLSIEKICHLFLGGFTHDFFKLLQPLFNKYDIDTESTLKELSAKQLHFFLSGDSTSIKIEGMSATYKGFNKTLVALARFAKSSIKRPITALMDKVPCPFCGGKKLNPLALHVTIKKKSIANIAQMPIGKALLFIKNLSLNKGQQKILKEVLAQLTEKLRFMSHIGIEYLSLDRTTPTLSGGELQRVRLSKQIGAKLKGVLYVLDEPTIGLHPSESDKLFTAIEDLKRLGNTIVIVEHDPQIMKKADRIYDMGPLCAEKGGKLVAEGTYLEIKKNKNSLTGSYLRGDKKVFAPKKPLINPSLFFIKKASLYNLKNVNVTLPIGGITCLTGPSGSGKSSLMQTLKEAFRKKINEKNGIVDLGYALVQTEHFQSATHLDQNPSFHHTRADVATYCELLLPMRSWFARLPDARAKGLEAKHFSYYHRRGMCPTCFGFGYKTIQLHLMPSVKIPCPDCKGCRLQPLSLSVRYKNKNLADYLAMSVENLLEHFEHIPKIKRIITALKKIHLGYLHLNQEIHTLSGGEAQRLRLASDLAKKTRGKNLYLFDEPTIGLHFSDVQALLEVFIELRDKGHTLVIIEHNTDVIKHADHIIDLGPQAGDLGGRIIMQGTLQQLKKSSSITARYL